MGISALCTLHFRQSLRLNNQSVLPEEGYSNCNSSGARIVGVMFPIVVPAIVPAHETAIKFRELIFDECAKLEVLKGEHGNCITRADGIVTMNDAFDVCDQGPIS